MSTSVSDPARPAYIPDGPRPGGRWEERAPETLGLRRDSLDALADHVRGRGLHAHSSYVHPPPGFDRPTRDRCALTQQILEDLTQHPVFTRRDRALFTQVAERVGAALDALGQSPETFGPIHADRHPRNVLFSAAKRGRSTSTTALTATGWPSWRWRSSAGRTGRMPIAESGPGQMPSVVGLLNDLGAEGWELAGVSNSQSPLIYRMLLKRRGTKAPSSSATTTRS